MRILNHTTHHDPQYHICRWQFSQYTSTLLKILKHLTVFLSVNVVLSLWVVRYTLIAKTNYAWRKSYFQPLFGDWLNELLGKECMLDSKMEGPSRIITQSLDGIQVSQISVNGKKRQSSRRQMKPNQLWWVHSIDQIVIMWLIPCGCSPLIFMTAYIYT